MSSLDYQVIAKRLYSKFPLFGSCIRQRSAQALAKDGSPYAIRLLAEAVKDSQDRKVVTIALECLRNLRSQDSINAFCRVWAETRNKDLTAILKSRRYIASEPSLRVLSALKIEASEVVRSSGVEDLEPLLSALSDKDSQIASTAANFIIKLENREAIDELCKRWAKSRNNELELILRNGNYIALKPIEVHVLTALKFNKYQIIVDEGVEILEPLLKAINDKDIKIASASKECIGQLRNRQTIDELCKRWIDTKSQVLERIIIQANYEPSDLKTKALFYFLLGKWQKYEDLDFDQSLLAKAYYAGSDNVKKNISEKARLAGRIEYIKLITNPMQGFDIEQMSEDEWNAFLDILAIKPESKEVWKFLRNASPILSKKLLDKFTRIGFDSFSLPEREQLLNLAALSKGITAEDLENLLGLKTIESINTLEGENWFLTLAFSPDRAILALASQHGTNTIQLRSVPDGKLLNTLEGIIDVVDTLTFSPDGAFLASNCQHGTNTIQLWSLSDGKLLNTLEGNRDWVRTLAFSPDGAILASNCQNKPKTSKNGRRDNRRIANRKGNKHEHRENNSTIQLTSLPDCKLLNTLEGHSDSVRNLVFTPDGTILASVSGDNTIDNTIKLWSIPDGELLNTVVNSLTLHSDSWVSHLTFSPDGEILAWAYPSCSDRHIVLFGVPNGWTKNTLEYQYGNERVKAIEFSPDGAILATNCFNDDDGWTIKLWSVPNGKLLNTLEGIIDFVDTLTFSPDGAFLVLNGSADSNTSIQLWSVPNGELINTLEGKSLTFSPDGTILALACQNDTGWTIELFRRVLLPICKFTNEQILHMEKKFNDSITNEGTRNALKFTLALIRLRQQFDIDIEEASSDTQPSPFDIEIEG